MKNFDSKGFVGDRNAKTKEDLLKIPYLEGVQVQQETVRRIDRAKIKCLEEAVARRIFEAIGKPFKSKICCGSARSKKGSAPRKLKSSSSTCPRQLKIQYAQKAFELQKQLSGRGSREVEREGPEINFCLSFLKQFFLPSQCFKDSGCRVFEGKGFRGVLDATTKEPGYLG